MTALFSPPHAYQVPSVKPSDATTVQRYDFTPIGKARITSQGFLKFDANLSRVGVLTYRKADGTEQRELRPPEEVFDSESVDSLAGAPVTDLHSAMVNPGNVRSLQMGIVGESVRHDSTFIQGTVTVQDQALIDKISAGERREGSPGYNCWLEPTPGNWNGERYDAIQRGIRYNHWALGPANWGRQGSEVALRLDSNAAASLEASLPDTKPKEIETMTTKRIIRIDNIEFDLDSDAARQAITQRLDTLESEKTAAGQKLGELQGKFDASQKENTELKGKLDAANDPKRIDTLVNERADLVAKCRSVLGNEEKLDGISAMDLQVKVLQKLDDKFDPAGKDKAYIQGLFDYSVKHHESRSDGIPAARKATPTPAPGKDKEEDKEEARYDASAAEERMLARNQEAWKRTA